MAQKKKWSDLTSGQQTAILVAGCIQLSLAATAWADLARRPASEVAGSKAKWAAIIAIRGFGPIAYSTRGRSQARAALTP